jgi:hypothetical protein
MIDDSSEDLLGMLCIAMSAIQGMLVVAHGGGVGSQDEFVL